MPHALERTNPKGQPFIGQCTLCGAAGLKLSQMSEHCPNPANLTQSDALNVALGLHDGEPS